MHWHAFRAERLLHHGQAKAVYYYLLTIISRFWLRSRYFSIRHTQPPDVSLSVPFLLASIMCPWLVLSGLTWRQRSDSSHWGSASSNWPDLSMARLQNGWKSACVGAQCRACLSRVSSQCALFQPPEYNNRRGVRHMPIRVLHLMLMEAHG